MAFCQSHSRAFSASVTESTRLSDATPDAPSPPPLLTEPPQPPQAMTSSPNRTVASRFMTLRRYHRRRTDQKALRDRAVDVAGGHPARGRAVAAADAADRLVRLGVVAGGAAGAARRRAAVVGVAGLLVVPGAAVHQPVVAAHVVAAQLEPVAVGVRTSELRVSRVA